MPISNTIINFPTAEIQFDPALRQRTDLDPERLFTLAASIAKTQWISPILVDKESLTLAAGGRRFTAIGLLASALSGDWTKFGKWAARAQEEITPKCTIASLENWTKIPTQMGSKLTPLDMQVFEWTENNARDDLTWQDKARAALRIHSMAREANPGWTDRQTAILLGVSPETFSQWTKPMREIETAPAEMKPRLQKLFDESTTPISAKQAIVTNKTRHGVPTTNRSGFVSLTMSDPEPDQPAVPFDSPIIVADFHKWAADYSGAPFNFVHCDFPYGINYNKGGCFGANPDTKSIGEYDDSPDIYWALLQSLAENQSRLLAPESHIMFWYSQNMEEETKQFFWEFFSDCHIHSHKMIWVHPSDQSTPDPTRYGQRNYETAMCVTFGDRKVARPVRLALVYEREGIRHHRSEKPLAVLNHFFPMFVDSSSRVLDPTCGSGTSIIAAKRLDAGAVLGLEMDEAMVETASKFYKEEIGQ